jgi:plastocyanin domain-containing protein
MRYGKYWLLMMMILLLALIATYAGAAETEKEKRFVAKIDPDGVQRVEILGGSYFFDPNYIVVKVNVPVELLLKKESGYTPHNFILNAPEAGIEVMREMGKEPGTIKFTPTKPGKYEFHCDKKLLFFKSHREKGMEGILEVTE